MGKQAQIECYTPREYYNDLFKKCIKKSKYIAPKYYYLITDNKVLQKYINQDVINEFLLDDRNIDLYIKEVFLHMPNIGENYIDVDNDKIIYDTISMVYNIRFTRKFTYEGNYTLCFATKK